MGSVYKRGRTWWLKYKDATGEWTPDATKDRFQKHRGRDPFGFPRDPGLVTGGV